MGHNVWFDKVSNVLNKSSKTNRTGSGFKRTSTFISRLTQQGFEKKGFAQAKLLINWNETVGLDLCKFSKPVKITFPKSGLGATLTIEINGALGPELDMQKEIIKEKVNRIYGYKAVAKIKFRVSSCLGYVSSKKERLFFNQVEKSSTDKKLRCNELAINSLMLQLSDVKDQKLRTSLKNLSNNFVNSRK